MKYSARAIINGVACFAFTLAISMADTHYVDISNLTPSAPYTNWTTAATSIQDAMDAAIDGDTIIVNEGIYLPSSTIVLNKGVLLKSRSGPDVTVIDADGIQRAIRIPAHNGACELNGFTVTGGSAYGGAGIWVDGNGPTTIKNCIIDGNTSKAHAGGLSIKASAGQAVEALVEQCVFRDNHAVNMGGGLYIQAPDSATCSIEVIESVFSSNSTDIDGGGIWCNTWNGSIGITGCTITNNVAFRMGGGIRCMRNIMLTDSLIAGNTAGSKGGGEHGGLVGNTFIVNCTIVSNQAPTGGGVSRSTILNSIVHGNMADNNPNITGDSEVAFSCSPKLLNGINGNINDNPQFRDTASGDYRLLLTSPCIDAGTNAFVSSLYDLDGLARIKDGNLDGMSIVDMGAYEFQASTVLIDIKPGSDTNPVNLKSKGRIPVALLNTDEFDAATIDPQTVRFAGAAPTHVALEDIDQDGDLDLLMHFLTQELQLTDTSTHAYLIGQTIDGQILMGVDDVTIVPKK